MGRDAEGGLGQEVGGWGDRIQRSKAALFSSNILNIDVHSSAMSPFRYSIIFNTLGEGIGNGLKYISQMYTNQEPVGVKICRGKKVWGIWRLIRCK